MPYEVIANFHDLEDGKRLYEKGNSYPREGLKPTKDRVKYIESRGFIKYVEEKEPENPDEVFPKHTDGGWYLLSNGEKVQGKEKAIAAEEALKSGE